MIRTVYVRRHRRPRPRTSLALLLGFVSIATAGCERDAPAEGDVRSEVSASDRDTSLAAIDRWLAAGQPESGEAIARVLLRRLPEDPHVRLALARTLIARAGRIQAVAGPDAARPLAREAANVLATEVELRTSGLDRAEWNRTRGLALETAGLDLEAIATYRETADRDRVAALYLGLALLRVGEREEAGVLLERLHENGTDDPYVLAALAEARFDPANPAPARTTIADAVRLDPDAWPIRLRQASIERRTGRPDVAIEMLTALPTSTRSERVVCAELALAWQALGRTDRAAEVWAARAIVHPDDVAAAIEAATLFIAAGRVEDAESWIRVVEGLSPDDARLSEMRAQLADLAAERVTGASTGNPARDR